MTVSTENSRIAYTGDGSTTAFAVNFYFLANGDLKVYQAGTLKTITTHYTVSGAGNPAGGTVTFLTAPAVDESVVIFRDPALTQQTDYAPNDPFPAESHEQALDRLTMISQRLKDRMDRAAVLPDTDVSGASPQLPTPSAGKGLRWNDAGTGLENTTDDIEDSAANAATSAAAAAASASSASTSATNAASSASSASTSATNAASSASAASTSATNAASSASSASTSATNAANSATSAANSATAAANSASAAATSESNAATSATTATNAKNDVLALVATVGATIADWGFINTSPTSTSDYGAL